MCTGDDDDLVALNEIHELVGKDFQPHPAKFTVKALELFWVVLQQLKSIEKRLQEVVAKTHSLAFVPGKSLDHFQPDFWMSNQPAWHASRARSSAITCSIGIAEDGSRRCSSILRWNSASSSGVNSSSGAFWSMLSQSSPINASFSAVESWSNSDLRLSFISAPTSFSYESRPSFPAPQAHPPARRPIA